MDVQARGVAVADLAHGALVGLVLAFLVPGGDLYLQTAVGGGGGGEVQLG